MLSPLRCATFFFFLGGQISGSRFVVFISSEEEEWLVWHSRCEVFLLTETAQYIGGVTKCLLRHVCLQAHENNISAKP